MPSLSRVHIAVSPQLPVSTDELSELPDESPPTATFPPSSTPTPPDEPLLTAPPATVPAPVLTEALSPDEDEEPAAASSADAMVANADKLNIIHIVNTKMNNFCLIRIPPSHFLNS